MCFKQVLKCLFDVALLLRDICAYLNVCLFIVIAVVKSSSHQDLTHAESESSKCYYSESEDEDDDLSRNASAAPSRDTSKEGNTSLHHTTVGVSTST